MRYGYSIVVFAVGLIAGPVRAQGVIEGTVHYLLKAWVAGDDVRQRPVELKAGVPLHVDFPAR